MSRKENNGQLRLGMTVAFCDQNQGFAFKGQIPWPHIRRDYEFFMDIVTSTADTNKRNGIMKGRLTYESASEADKNNPKTSVVVTSTTMTKVPANCRSVVTNYDAAMEDLLSGVDAGELENIWVLGGGQNYERAINDPRFTLLYVTRIFNDFPVDRYFPKFTHQFTLVSTSEKHTDNNISFQFETWEKTL